MPCYLLCPLCMHPMVIYRPGAYIRRRCRQCGQAFILIPTDHRLTLRLAHERRADQEDVNTVA